MSKLVVGTFLSLDGVMQAPGAPDEDRDGGFQHGGWAVPHFDDRMGQILTDQLSQASALLLGRKTYDIFAASWPLAGNDDPMAAKLNSVAKYVVSRTLNTVEWDHSTLLTGNIAEQVTKLKQQPDEELQVSGSGELIQTLVKNDLVDEYRLMIFPVLVGTGKRLFADGTIPCGLKLVSTTTSSTGVVINTYRPHGELDHGAMGPELQSDQ